ncbi:hypothetical protein [Corynebacterium renale]|uniref:hypothetical protein n=1 Tax=Corynebacterium renale TaxID=1724 RepID=UPI000E014425|nr:hypothetical protein [Corynebacterium renale]STC97514.1 immunity-specific protein Beta201 [Corynebacterium renale]
MAMLSWVSHTGAEQALYPATGEVFLEGGTLEGFTGKWQDNPTQIIGVPGAWVDPRNRVIEPLTGALSLRVMSAHGWHQVRQMFSHNHQGTLVLGGWRLPCRLAEALPAPGTIPTAGAVVRVALIADGGVWVSPVTATGAVTVTNAGDVPVWPTIMWKGNGGKVTLPSGASFILPATPTARTIDLNRSSSGVVRAADGEIDAALSRTVDSISECVPVGHRGVFTVPTGATMTYNIGVLDVFAEVDSWI